MIDYDRVDETMVVECDECGDEIEVEGDFQECITAIKLDGWVITPEAGSFKHICPDCA